MTSAKPLLPGFSAPPMWAFFGSILTAIGEYAIPAMRWDGLIKGEF